MARLLVVDDDRAVLNALAFFLSGAGHIVNEATSAEGAKERMQDPCGEYDVIVTDMRMEEEDSGVAVVKAAQDMAPSTPVIVLTGYAEIADSVKSMKAGAFSYLTKRGEDGEDDLLLMHIQRAIHYRTGRRLDDTLFFDALDRALEVFIPVLGTLNTVTAQLKSLADARNRVLSGLTRGETGARGDANR
jgi:DNA-binding NtrC family response regulator